MKATRKVSTLGLNVRFLRTKLGFTQQKLIDQINEVLNKGKTTFNRQVLNNLETGRVETCRFAIEISMVLKVNPIDLTRLEHDKFIDKYSNHTKPPNTHNENSTNIIPQVSVEDTPHATILTIIIPKNICK